MGETNSSWGQILTIDKYLAERNGVGGWRSESTVVDSIVNSQDLTPLCTNEINEPNERDFYRGVCVDNASRYGIIIEWH